jgi:hypothetical protein
MEGRVFLDIYRCTLCGKKWGELYVKMEVVCILNADKDGEVIVADTPTFEENQEYILSNVMELYQT